MTIAAAAATCNRRIDAHRDAMRDRMARRMGTRTALALAAMLVLGCIARLAAAEAPACPLCAADPHPAAAATDHLSDDPWVIPAHRIAPGIEAQALEGSADIHRWGDLRGKPTVLTCIFTRCSNPTKCPRAARALGDLARAAVDAHLAGTFHAAICTYDPGYDTGERLAAWAQRHGVDPALGVLLLRPATATVASVVQAFHLGVSFTAGGSVAVHDLELLVLDRQARVAHHYHTTLWDTQTVLADVRRLLAEPIAH